MSSLSFYSKTTLTNLWNQLRDQIDATYSGNWQGNESTQDIALLRDFSRNTGWVDRLESLLEREMAHERRHRSGCQGRTFPLTVNAAARLVIMENIARGAEAKTFPLASIFLEMRDTAAESRVLGFILRSHLLADWLATAKALDYSAAMRADGANSTVKPKR